MWGNTIVNRYFTHDKKYAKTAWEIDLYLCGVPRRLWASVPCRRANFVPISGEQYVLSIDEQKNNLEKLGKGSSILVASHPTDMAALAVGITIAGVSCGKHEMLEGSGEIALYGSGISFGAKAPFRLQDVASYDHIKAEDATIVLHNITPDMTNERKMWIRDYLTAYQDRLVIACCVGDVLEIAKRLWFEFNYLFQVHG